MLRARDFGGTVSALDNAARDSAGYSNQPQPQHEQRAHDDHGDKAHRAEGLLLNVGDRRDDERDTCQVTRCSQSLASYLKEILTFAR